VSAAPTVVRRKIRHPDNVAGVGESDGVRERFHGIWIERRITYRAVVLIADRLRRRLFT
jgi:hypothetical protein